MTGIPADLFRHLLVECVACIQDFSIRLQVAWSKVLVFPGWNFFRQQSNFRTNLTPVKRSFLLNFVLQFQIKFSPWCTSSKTRWRVQIWYVYRCTRDGLRLLILDPSERPNRCLVSPSWFDESKLDSIWIMDRLKPAIRFRIVTSFLQTFSALHH